MSFLQPWLLFALPLVTIPIVIHLINQRRYQTVRWGAMMFLLEANRMARGFARVRQWLIMAFRVLAIACLVFAISRPLGSGWLGLAGGGRPDTTILIIDRSASMQQNSGLPGDSKLKTGCRQLVETLKTLGSAHWVLIDSVTNRPQELSAPDALLNSAAYNPTSAASDVPGMLQAAYDYIEVNQTGRTDIWICSDLRKNDWNPESGRWQSLRESFLRLRQGVRLNLLAYPEAGTGNVSIRVFDVRRQQNRDLAELVMSLRLAREGDDSSAISIPVQVEIEGVRSQLLMAIDRNQAELRDFRFPLDGKKDHGWGRVTIPADANPADNDFYFAFDKPVARQAVVVADDAVVAAPLQLAATISPDPGVQCTSELVSEDKLSSVNWDKVALLIWQHPLPEGAVAKRITEFIQRGGCAIFLPTAIPGAQSLFGVRWTGWINPPGNEMLPSNWRGDQDLLAHTQSGATLPVGQIQVKRYCGLKGEFTPLAMLPGRAPLLARCSVGRGEAYFLATTPALGDSSLARNGIVQYVLVQRALARGASVLGNVSQRSAGETGNGDLGSGRRMGGAEEAVSSEYLFHRGIYATEGNRLVAINRPAEEDKAPILTDAAVVELFRGLDFHQVDRRVGHIGSLIQEIWRPFLASMLLAMVAESALCLPRAAPQSGRAA